MNVRAVAENIPAFCRSLRTCSVQTARSVVTTAKATTGDLVRELRRLNSVGTDTEEFADANRRAQARIVRDRLKMGYRGHTPCC